MSYQRTTIDFWDIEQQTCQGWDSISCRVSWCGAKNELRTYRENQPECPVRMRQYREKRSKYDADQLKRFNMEAIADRQEYNEHRAKVREAKKQTAQRQACNNWPNLPELN